MSRKIKAVFLDRDGTINIERNYIITPNRITLIKSSVEAIRIFNNLGIKVFVITNQSAIARGYMKLEEYYIINSRFLDLLKNNNVFVDKVYFSPYHIDGKIKKYKKFDISRKPNPGMLFQASKEYSIPLNESWLIGDNINDIKAGCNANIFGCTLVLTGHGKKFRKEVLNLKYKSQIKIKKNLFEATKDILKVD